MAKATKVDPVRTVDVAERRARFARRHLLLPGDAAAAVTEVVDALVALHATDPATVYLSIWARTAGVGRDDVACALHEDRSVQKLLCMRRTIFAVRPDLIPVAAAAATRAVAVRERKSLALHLSWVGVDRPEAFVDAAVEAIAAALERLGDTSAAALADDVPALRQEVNPAPGRSYGAMGRITTRVLTIAAAEGRAVRGRPMGGITSSQTRWEPAPAGLAEAMASLDEGEARAALVHLWLRAFGPGTDADVAWWAGCTLGQARAALAACEVVPVDLGRGVGWLLPDDVEVEPATEAWVALLPGLDPTPMGWKDRDWYLGPHKAALFDTNGNVGPTVWCDGRIVGGWAQRKDGSVVWRLVESVPKRAEKALAARAAELEAWLGDVRVTPRFSTPIDKELSRGGGP